MKKKKTIIIISIIVIILVAIGIWSQGRQKSGSASTWGLMEEAGFFPEGDAYMRDCFTLTPEGLVDVQFDVQIESSNGPIQYHIICSINDEVVYEEEQSGVSTVSFTSKSFKNKKGEMKLEIIVPNDAKGKYTLEIRTKKTNLTKLIETIKDFLKKDK